MSLSVTEERRVSLDLETTGLSPDRDDIIEVAAVKFEGEKVVDSFHSLINPGRPVPRRIQALTGISQDELDGASPPLPTLQQLVSFIEGWPVVGHNIAFDLGFLSAKGFGLGNPSYDTHELASILLPDLPEYSLVSLASHLGVSHPSPHRALPDASTVHKVFIALLYRVALLKPSVLQEILNLSLNTGWQLRPLFQGTMNAMALPLGAATFSIENLLRRPGGIPEERDSSLQPEILAVPDIEGMASLLEPGGVLEKAFPGFEHRPEQVQLMKAIASALNEGQNLVAEAGTGTGKSLAYLLPSLFLALRDGSRVVISTSTINLQEQLINKDMPQLVQSLSPLPPVRVAQLKGRSNYLCPKAWETLRYASSLSAEDVRLLLRTLVWLTETATGDRSELSLSPGENRTWRRLCASAEACQPACLHRREGRCFLHNARSRAEKAHLVVVNHALLLSDMVAENRIIPEFRHLIVDEAHHLEEEATHQLGLDVYPWEIEGAMQPFFAAGGGKGALLRELEELLSRMAPEARKTGSDLLQQLAAAAQAARGYLSSLLEALASLVKRSFREQGDYERRLRITPSVREQPRWSTVESLWERAHRELSKAADAISRYVSLLEGQPSSANPRKGLVPELSSLYYSMLDVARRLDLVLAEQQQERLISWVSLGGNEQVSLHAVPLEVGPALERSLFSQKDCVVLTSATLAASGSFRYVKRQLGVEEAGEVVVGSPFDYPRSTLVCVAQDVPEPDQAGYQEAISRTLIDLVVAARGRTLVLFTSNSALKGTYAILQPALEERGMTVLGQGIDGSPRKVVEAFRTLPAGVLLGTSSLWEGIDVPGEALSVVVLPRLPFEVPTDPIYAARSELFEDSFREYALPQSVLRFRQGFGRLIRSKKDRGALVLLDRRLHSRRYGASFIRSLPPCTVKTLRARDIPSEVSRWLENGSSVEKK